MGNRLAGQSVLVLGGRHLGKAIAAAATAEGARVHVASHRPGGLHIDLRDEATIAAAAAELGPVRVNTLSPGIIDSGAWDAKGDAKADFLATAAQRTLIGRTGTVVDVTDAVLWLLQAEFLTGETVHIEGGRL